MSGPDGGAAVAAAAAAAYKAVALQKQELLEYWSNRDVLRLEILEIHRWADKLHGCNITTRGSVLRKEGIFFVFFFGIYSRVEFRVLTELGTEILSGPLTKSC